MILLVYPIMVIILSLTDQFIIIMACPVRSAESC